MKERENKTPQCEELYETGDGIPIQKSRSYSRVAISKTPKLGRAYQPMTGDPIPVINSRSYRSRSKKSPNYYKSEARSEESEIEVSPRKISHASPLNHSLDKTSGKSPSKKIGVPALHTGHKRPRIAEEREKKAYLKRRADLKTVHHAEREHVTLQHVPKESEEYIIAQFRMKGARVLHVPYTTVAHPAHKTQKEFVPSPKKTLRDSVSKDSSKKKSVDRHCHRKITENDPVSEFDVDYWAKEVGVTQEKKLKGKIERLIYKDQGNLPQSRSVSRNRSRTHQSLRQV